MPLEVIGCAPGRTGTFSLHLALNRLGYKTHHMKEVGMHGQDTTAWIKAYDHPGTFGAEGWDKVYEGYDAAVDYPTVDFYKGKNTGQVTIVSSTSSLELMEVYPNAKLILTIRSPESWYKSVCNTIFKHYLGSEEEFVYPPGQRGQILRLVTHTAMGGLLRKDRQKLKDEKYICDLYRKHNEEVIKTVPPERLLIMQLGEGYEKLCPFLGKPIPDEPYPNSNSTEEFQAREVASRGDFFMTSWQSNDS
ncbi:hypothetical protein DM01DRAFT_1305790 [Hesseltinella vesiculosa]|uniref:P-loop containing nucleoside triphosphate hydrolase protein n=1 Tax=Hesseltinella vesiculosa TaxID=101127 RepID=A0A1X2GH27_9FUNG|nr:hypothetical protein DM01DRAFT_1305790 [Hesseltinella vesiculosa]